MRTLILILLMAGVAYGGDLPTNAEIHNAIAADHDSRGAVMHYYIDGPVIDCIGDPELCARMIAEHEASLKPSIAELRDLLERCLEFVRDEQELIDFIKSQPKYKQIELQGIVDDYKRETQLRRDIEAAIGRME